VTIAFGIVVMVFNPMHPAMSSPFLGIPSIAIGSAMACRVFRQIRIGLMADDLDDIIPLGKNGLDFTQRPQQRIVTPSPEARDLESMGCGSIIHIKAQDAVTRQTKHLSAPI
jgi:hypothetical protein